MAEAGYGPNRKLKVSDFVRQSTLAIHGATRVANPLRAIPIDGDVDPKEYTLFTGRLANGGSMLVVHATVNALDDPDIVLTENFLCDSPGDYTQYCNKDVEAKIHGQSMTIDPKNRRERVRQIKIALQQDNAKPILFQVQITRCRHPNVKGLVKGGNGNDSHNQLQTAGLGR